MIHLDRPAYLGLDRSAAFRNYFGAGVRDYGLHFAGSRAASYCPGVYDEAEAFLAESLGVEAALLTSSGSLAAKLATEGLEGLGYDIGDARGAGDGSAGIHPAWGSAGRGAAGGGSQRAVRRVSVDPITLAVTPPPQPDADVLDVTDASHDLFLRPGTPLLEGKLHRRQLLVGSLGKALSVPAGIVAGPAAVVEAVRGLAAFRGASPPPPAYVSAVLEGWRLVEAAQRRLSDIVAAVAGSPNGSTLRGYPVILVRDVSPRTRLREGGFVLSAVPYPTLASEVAYRVVLRADLRDDVVGALTRALR